MTAKVGTAFPTVVPFPADRVVHGIECYSPTPATVLILPTVRIERQVATSCDISRHPDSPLVSARTRRRVRAEIAKLRRETMLARLRAEIDLSR
jgi:hypothetical protein